MKPMPGVRLTLIGRDIETPYSGMIPGFVAGAYSFDECHIDLARLCGLDRCAADPGRGDRARPHQPAGAAEDRPPVSYDLVSLDVGSSPSMGAIPGAAEHATPVKPIAELGQRWLGFLERVKDWRGALRIAVIGGGAGGVELALAIDHRLRTVARQAEVSVTLATRGEILSGQAAAARQRMRAIFARRGVHLLENAATTRIDADAVHLETGERLAVDDVFVVTEATAARGSRAPACRSILAASSRSNRRSPRAAIPRCSRPATAPA